MIPSSGPDGTNEPQPIIIVRRKRLEDEGHHGGAWKIAFADFMTAMMALFLVLWLVNASDADTREAVASYFNPVKLVDRERSRRGLGSPGTVQEDGQKDGALAEPDATDGDRKSAVQATEREEEARFLAAPEAVLDEREAAALRAGGTGSRDTVVETTLASELRPTDPYALDVAPEPTTRPAAPSAPETVPVLERKAAPAPEREPKPEPELERVSEPEPDERTAAEIRDAIREALPDDSALADAVKVTKVEGGTLVQLTDGPGYAMFDTGSFLPTGRTVVAVKAIAKVLSARPGGVRIEGHTDAVPFTGSSDNWRLSTERAHAARLTLLRGGLSAERLRQVTGFAASRPLEGARPNEPRNRRIEILLERS